MLRRQLRGYGDFDATETLLAKLKGLTAEARGQDQELYDESMDVRLEAAEIGSQESTQSAVQEENIVLRRLRQVFAINSGTTELVFAERAANRRSTCRREDRITRSARFEQRHHKRHNSIDCRGFLNLQQLDLTALCLAMRHRRHSRPGSRNRGRRRACAGLRGP